MRKPTRAVFGSLALAAALAFSSGGARAQDYWQCVTFARMFSGIQIFGDAATWWRGAIGKYAEGDTPAAGAVLVFKPSNGMSKGHVAVVSEVLTDRIIQVTHANWSAIGGHRGQVEKDVTVVDVSPHGDWTQVKVWYDPARDLGSSVYPTYGFIYQSAQATAENAARTAVRNVAQTAISQMASAVPTPGASPAQLLSQAAADSTDKIAALIAAVTAQQQPTQGGGEH